MNSVPVSGLVSGLAAGLAAGRVWTAQMLPSESRAASPAISQRCRTPAAASQARITPG